MAQKKLMRSIVIAIDGPAAAGKSTTAREVARRLGLLYLDTGAMYRGVTLKALKEGLDLTDGNRIAEMTRRTAMRFEMLHGEQHLFVDGVDATIDIRRPEVTAGTTPISSHPQVRAILVEWQRDLGAHGGVVAEGRDTTSVVFPNADLKIFLKASLEQRAIRRVEDLQKTGVVTTLAEQIDLISRRDQADSSRAASPLTRVASAVEIDTSGITVEEQVQRVIDLAREVAGV